LWSHLVLPIFITMSMPDTTLPKTGCWDGDKSFLQ